ncbi:dethiobiotin synthase [Desulfolithobacter sp.]
MVKIAVCAIDTDIGKSVVTGLLARFLKISGTTVTTMKPVQTGCLGKPEDILMHRRIMETDWDQWDEQGLTCPYCLPFPGSPHLAARLADTAIDPQRLDQAMDELEAHHQWLVVEGAGGLLVPLSDELTWLDYLQERHISVILVTSPRLGSINHTLLSLEAIRARGVRLSGLVYNLHGNHPKEIVLDSLRVFRRSLGQYGFAEKVILLPDTRESLSTNWAPLLADVEGAD